MPQRALTAAGTRPKKVEEYPAKNTYNLGANYLKPRMCFQKSSKALKHGDLGPSQASNAPREQHDANELQRCHRLLPNLAEKQQGKLSTGNAYPTIGSPCIVYLRYQMQFWTCCGLTSQNFNIFCGSEAPHVSPATTPFQPRDLHVRGSLFRRRSPWPHDPQLNGLPKFRS